MSVWWAKSQTDQLQPVKTNCYGLNCYEWYRRLGEEEKMLLMHVIRPFSSNTTGSYQTSRCTSFSLCCKDKSSFQSSFPRKPWSPSQMDAKVQVANSGGLLSFCWSKWCSMIHLCICPMLSFFPLLQSFQLVPPLPSKYFYQLAVSSYSKIRNMSSFSP